MFHFTAGDDPSCSLHPLVGRGLGHRLNWLGCTAIICGGDDSRESNCLADEVLAALYGEGIEVEGVADNSACGVNADGNWYATLY